MQLKVTSLKWLHCEPDTGYSLAEHSSSVVSEPEQSVRWKNMGPLPYPAYVFDDGEIEEPIQRQLGLSYGTLYQ